MPVPPASSLYVRPRNRAVSGISSAKKQRNNAWRVERGLCSTLRTDFQLRDRGTRGRLLPMGYCNSEAIRRDRYEQRFGGRSAARAAPYHIVSKGRKNRRSDARPRPEESHALEFARNGQSRRGQLSHRAAHLAGSRISAAPVANFKFSKDLPFVEKLRDIVAVNMNPPTNARAEVGSERKHVSYAS